MVEDIRKHLDKTDPKQLRAWAAVMGIQVRNRTDEAIRADLEQRLLGVRQTPLQEQQQATQEREGPLAGVIRPDLESGERNIAVHVANLPSTPEAMDRALDKIAKKFPALSRTSRSLEPVSVKDDNLARLWIAIRLHSDAIAFPNFNAFMERVLGGTDESEPARNLGEKARKLKRRFPVPGTDLYGLLRTAAETFLLLEGGTVPRMDEQRWQALRIQPPTDPATGDPLEPGDDVLRKYELLASEPFDLADAEAKLTAYLGTDKTSYVRAIMRNVFPSGEFTPGSALSPLTSEFASAPFLIELIWSYWIEESLLCQSMSALTLRFQNVLRRGGPDPLAELELDPLRPLSGVLWGYIQQQHMRLSVVRRAYEYMHEYNFPLHGAAVADIRSADPRAHFVEAFHSLLRECDVFMKQDSDTTVVADAFPVLNALKQVHLNMSAGAHNQFRDLPWTARAEMLVEQWIVSQPEIREFLRGRYSVPYPEDWMGAVDAMKRVQGWGGASSLHFGGLAKFGERLLLSIRHYPWNSVDDPLYAHAWVRFWREEIQGYIHAYKAVTGVSLIDAPVVHAGASGDGRFLPPSVHLRKRMLEARTSGD